MRKSSFDWFLDFLSTLDSQKFNYKTNVYGSIQLVTITNLTKDEITRFAFVNGELCGFYGFKKE